MVLETTGIWPPSWAWWWRCTSYRWWIADWGGNTWECGVCDPHRWDGPVWHSPSQLLWRGLQWLQRAECPSGHTGKGPPEWNLSPGWNFLSPWLQLDYPGRCDLDSPLGEEASDSYHLRQIIFNLWEISLLSCILNLYQLTDSSFTHFHLFQFCITYYNST